MREDALLCAEVSSEDRMALPPDPPPPPEPRPPNPPILEELDCRDTRRRRNATVARAVSFACQPKNNVEKKRTLQGGFINSADDDTLSLSPVMEVRAAQPCAKALSYSSQTAFAQPSTVAASRASSRVYIPGYERMSSHTPSNNQIGGTIISPCQPGFLSFRP